MNIDSKSFIAEWTSYVFLCGIFFALTALWLYLSLTRPIGHNFWDSGWLATIICASCSIAFVFWLARFKIVITDNYIDYRGGFSRTKRIEYSKVHKWFFGWVSFKNISRELPILRLVIQTDTETIVMNIKPFSRQCVQLLNATLTERCGEPKKQWDKMSSLSRRVLDQVLKK